MIQVIKRALDILQFVANDRDEPSSLTEIAKAVSLNQATCANIIRTLVDNHYLEHMGRKKGYMLGAMAYKLTGNNSYSNNLVQEAKDIMDALTNKYNETCLLGILRNNKRFILHIVHSNQDLQVRSQTERNIYETATGRLLMSFLSPSELDGLIQSIGLPEKGDWEGVTKKNELEKALGEIRKAELVYTLSVKHIVGLAVPVKKNDKVIASLSFFMPESRCTPVRKKELIIALKDAAMQINERLGV